MADRFQVAIAEDPAERLASLFDAHYDRLYRLARRLVSSSDDALDLVQETFLRIARSPESVPAGAANQEEAWLVRVLVNIRRDQWRKQKIRSRHDRAVEKGFEAPQRSPTPETMLITKSTVWSALDLLPPRRRAVIVLHELDGMPILAIAALLGLSAITVRWHLSGGRRDLARILKHHLGDTK
jgi:RNA polymerase sigma-70 factor, ECF subfamily